jgi:GNAT superfamily N-acetyltransferase
MTRDEIREIADIVGGDRTYSHFVRRINKEFDLADANRNSNVFVRTIEEDGKKIGFCVLGYSPAKMQVWRKTFNEEGWVNDSFEMDESPFELMYMYVRPEYRNKGFGTRLLKGAKDFAKEKGIKEIYSYVSDQKGQALDFYKKMSAEIIKDFSDGESVTAFIRWRLT